jgi:hypothetical protein
VDENRLINRIGLSLLPRSKVWITLSVSVIINSIVRATAQTKPSNDADFEVKLWDVIGL